MPWGDETRYSGHQVWIRGKGTEIDGGKSWGEVL
jgi:hypothetical protein